MRAIDSVGIVLAGGKSSRMGRDKSFLSLKSQKFFLLESYKKLKFLCKNVRVSIREEQREEYSKHVPNEFLVSDSIQNLEGPLQGIFSSFLPFQNDPNVKNFLVLAVDIPYMRIKTLARLYSKKEIIGSGVFYQTGEGIEPLCGLYSSEYLRFLFQEFEKGVLNSISPKVLIQRGNPSLLEVPEMEKSSFINLNSPEDLKPPK
ncbi:molybdopterin-guanine dinucleotide biosynthesis protein MobA [Leptospira hartskeerlii]|uniref:Probable molybdenum cofactor guanylyltransferase n=1 Tax=Leptospira hartskeerlii TaxID=2023177 RepID=A0A2M9XBM7_9LEPT|nr:molybdenum cofactor guanylyltransferase [Leptospira hartskeerlii]PJZ25088.1 molybdopterin-guanine dinucleotide biosynthesis protein MobA [Leptospira hartskeerlii]PJZ33481.1 molybdopterin-guanine dinucleotide biosynthesis protein MobA [Leptospira hartskeerlii]